MGTAYGTLVGPPPEVGKYEWHHWYARLLERRIAECNKTRATTYYFAQSGNDTTGDGTIGNPYKTIAKAQALIDASSGDIACLFKRGDQWRETIGIYSDKPKVTVGDYGLASGAGAKPFFNRFTIDYLDAANPWTLAAGDRYTTAETATVAWVREKNDRLNPYTKVASTAEVEATPRSWYWAANVLHLNAGTGVDPNTKDFEAVAANSAVGVELAGDGSLIRNIRADGWGMDPADTGNQKHGIKTSPNGTDAVLVVGCESYYNSSHAIAFNGGGNPSNSGGINTFIDCKAGLCIPNASGETIFNSYVSSHDHETIFHHCTAAFGTLPSGTGAYTPNARSFFGHGDATGSPKLFVAYRCRADSGTWCCKNGVRCESNNTVTQLIDVRIFNVFEDFNDGGSGPTGLDQDIAYKNTASVNCRWWVKPAAYASTPTGLTGSSKKQSGWCINSVLTYDLANQGPFGCAVYFAGATGGEDLRVYHSWIKAINANGSPDFFIDGRTRQTAADTDSDNAELKNSIVTVNKAGPSNTYVGFNGDGARMVANAYSVDTFIDSTSLRRYSMDTARVEVSSADGFESLAPTSASPLYRKGINLGVEYDIDLRPRNPLAPTIGPFEPWVASVPASDVVAAINSAVATVDTYLTDGRVKLSPVDGISDPSMREALLAYIAGKSAVVDHGNGTKTITYKKQDGATAKLAITFNTSGEFVATTVS